MIRTRDFLLVLVSIVFLVLAITVTALSQTRVVTTDIPLEPSAVPVSTSTAEVPSSETSLDRAERVAKMREKIAASGLVTIANPQPTVEETQPEATTTDELVEPRNEPLLCPGYGTYTNPWPATEIVVEAGDIARRYYVTGSASPAAASSSASSTITISERTLLTIPRIPLQTGTPYCLSSDVIGVAIDGSLIRNNEVGLYGIFSGNTLVGYALDGVPIYGTADRPADSCGGVVAAEGYRYQISPDSANILNCFSAQPALLP